MIASLAMLSLLAAAPPDVYAVVIGHNGGLAAADGRAALSPLNYADDDALRFSRWLSALPNVRRVEVLTRLDASTRDETLEVKAPTRTAVFAALQSLEAALSQRPAGRTARVYVFYAGHGLSGRLLLEPELGAEAALTGAELQSALAALSADEVLLFVDACRSQSLFSERGVDLSAEMELLDAKSAKARVGVLTAARTDRPAGEAASLQGGFFSHVLVSALSGAADVDGNETVSFRELAAFVAFHTEGLTGQRPWFSPPGNDLGAPVATLSGATRLKLEPDLAGRVRVQSMRGLPIVAEAHTARGRSVRLVVPPGTWQVVRDGAAATVALEAGAEKTLAASDFAAAPSARGVTDEAVFASPFTPEAVATLDAGWSSAREPVSIGYGWRDAVDLAGLLSTAPFGLPAADIGVEAGYRHAFGGPFAGLRVAFRSTAGAQGAMRRFGGWLVAGWRFALLQRLELSPMLMVGARAVQVVRAGGGGGADPFAPAVGAAARAEVALTKWLAVWLDARFEAAWVNVDGVRTFTAEPGAALGVAVRLGREEP